jgi:integrase
LRIFQITDQLRDDRSRPRSALFCMPVLLRVLYATGIRVGEALNLNLDDVDLEKKCFILRGCKNGEDRMIPISDSLAGVCGDYLSRWNLISANKDNRYFFISRQGYPVRQDSCYDWWRKILFLAGIPHQGRGAGPRLHDLRHTFSVHALAKLGKQEIDLYYALPILSTYLGHKSLSSTDKYVRLTADMYPSLVDRMNRAYPFLYPQINENQKYETN